MCSRCKPSGIRETEILRYHKPLFRLRRNPDNLIRSARQALAEHRVDIVTGVAAFARHSRRDVLVQLDFHLKRGTSSAGKSSSAEAAANAMAAFKSSMVSDGMPAQISD